MSLWKYDEDQFVMLAAFVTQQWSLEVPMMDVIDIFHVDNMVESKRRRWMHHYKECVKRQLLLNGAEKTHLSKNPVMSGWVQSIIDTFPDARIVVVVRNPAECLPSVLKLVEHSWKARGWQLADYAHSLQILTDISFESFKHPRQVLHNNPATPRVMIDYRELTGEPRKTVNRVYTELGMRVSGEFDAYLQGREERERSHEPRFEYKLDDFDVSIERIETELSDFYDSYGWSKPQAAEVSASAP